MRLEQTVTKINFFLDNTVEILKKIYSITMGIGYIHIFKFSMSIGFRTEKKVCISDVLE